MNLLNNFLFIALPYVAVAVFLAGSIYRYRASGYEFSALSSQFLEGRGGIYPLAVLFHWCILLVFAGHLATFLFPGAMLALLSDPVRLLVLETLAVTLGLGVLVGLAGLLVRRMTRPRIRAVTSTMDTAIELLLIAQFVLGLGVALGYRWGYSWFASDLAPYLWSIVTLNPKIEAVSALPWVVRMHVVGAFIIVGMIPFTRLVHFLVAPLHYVWRPYQQVMWHWDRKRVRDPATAWTAKRPTNN
jgi:nitrate reductase gamma subunit